jgi:ComF family protein
MELIKSTKTFILDTLFPIACLGCGRDAVWLCEGCQKNIALLSFQKCPACENAITESGSVCRKCRPDSKLDALLVAARYKEDNIDKLVHLYKYRFISDLHVPLGELLVKTLVRSKLSIPDIIIPVPLHPRRLRWRGFNQSQLLADHIGKNLVPNLEIAVDGKTLIREKYTAPQMKIKKYSERLANLKDAFAIKKGREGTSPADLHDKTILLVDDIATTGSTLSECAKTLKARGAKKVFGIVVARQEM